MLRPSRAAAICVTLFGALAPLPVCAQALTSIMSLRVNYNTRKVLAKPTVELKAQLDSVDSQLAAATQRGDGGQQRRLLAHGTTLLAGRAWTDSADYTNSLLLRTDRVVVESQKAYAVRLEQLYAPTPVSTAPVTARATLVNRAAGTNQLGAPAKQLGIFTAASRNFQKSPLIMNFDVHDVPDGAYNVVVEARDSMRVLGIITMPIVVRKGIDDAMLALQQKSASAPDAARAEILFPVDRMKNVNNGNIELRMFDIDKDIAAAQVVVAAVDAGHDAFANRTGDVKRHYMLDAAQEIMPYRVYVPTAYKAGVKYPLIVALHGLGQTEDSFFDAYGRKLPQLAEQFGYIVVAPLGYRVDGFYGWGVGSPPADSATRRLQSLSEMDVMQVLANAQKQYSIDPDRIYLLGHSMGAIGAWNIAPKFPGIWAAMAVFSGQGAPASLALTKRIPEFVVHGDADATVNVRGSRTMVAAMKTLGTEVTYVEVPGGSHTGVVEPNLPAAIAFFNAHKKSSAKQ